MIQIRDFHKGQSMSSYTTEGAYSKSVNLDVFLQPGIARINYLPTGYSTNVDSLPTGFATNSNHSRRLYFCDDEHDVYKFTTDTGDLIKMGDDKGNSIEVFNNTLYAINKTVINYSTNFADWSILSETFSSLSVKDNHFMFVSRNDGKLYICGSYSGASGFGIAKLETDGTWTQHAFKTPKDYKPISLTELGGYIIVSAKKVRGTTETDIPETTYFFWDKVSPTVYDKVITIPERDMNVFIKRGDRIYVAGGEMGNIYRITESGFEFYTQIPFDYDNKKVKIGNFGAFQTDGGDSFQSGAWWNGRLMIGVTSIDTLSPAGIYGIKNKVVSHEFLPSHGDDASVNDVFIGGMIVFVDGNLYYGWKRIVGETTTYGIDKVSTANNRLGSYGSYFESIFYPLGSKLKNTSFARVEVQLSRPLQTGEGVRIKYRRDINGSWTTLGTRDFSTDGAQSSLHFNGIKNIENIQIRCELTTGSSANTPYINAVMLI